MVAPLRNLAGATLAVPRLPIRSDATRDMPLALSKGARQGFPIMRSATVPLLLALVLAGAGCEYPQDADGTLARIQKEHVLRIGFSNRPPWIAQRNGHVSGIEARLARKLAAAFGASVEWIGGTESALLRALHERQIDLIVAGLTKGAPLVKQAAPTQVCVRAKVIVAGPAEAALPGASGKLSGESVAYVRDRPDFAGMIAAIGATPRPVSTVRKQISAVYDFEARSLGLVPSQVELAQEDIVMLVPRGESAMLLQVDRFLSRNCGTVMSELETNEAG